MNASQYISNFEEVNNWINNSLDEIRNNLIAISYPLFVYLYLDLVNASAFSEAKIFFNQFKHQFPAFSDEITELGLIKDPINYNSNIVKKYMNNKLHVFIPKIIFDVFLHFLKTSNLDSILRIINTYFEKSSLLSKVKDSNFVMLNLSSEDIEKINCRTAIYTSKIKKETDLNLKSKKIKGDKSLLAKTIIPIPEQYFDLQALDNTCIKIEPNSPPTIGCFTVLNTNNKMNCCDFTEDGGLIAVGLKDGMIQVWILDKDFPDEINKELIEWLEDYKEKNYFKMLKGGEIQIKINSLNEEGNSDSEQNLAWDYIIKNRRQFTLQGHSEAVYSVSFSPDNKYLISGGFDETVRLWSLLTRQILTVYKGHFSPVLTVKFSPMSHYFATGGCDRTTKLWAINCSTPLRQFVGHLSDVELIEFHPNGLYLATSANDSTVRLWCLENGECARVIYNYTEKSYVDTIAFSNSGKILAIACNYSLVIYDLIKMGDPIRIIDNFSSSPIHSIAFDMEDSVIAFSSEDYKLNIYDFHLLLNDQLPIRMNMNDYKNNPEMQFIASYQTKKTALLALKFTHSNVLLSIGRFDDNDPKIFM